MLKQMPVLLFQFEHTVFPSLTWIGRYRPLVSIPHPFSVAVQLPTNVIMHASAERLVGASGGVNSKHCWFVMISLNLRVGFFLSIDLFVEILLRSSRRGCIA